MIIAHKYNALYGMDETTGPFTIKCLSGNPSFEWSYFASSFGAIPDDYRFPIDLLYSLNGGEWKPMIPAFPNLTIGGGLSSTGTIVKTKTNDVLRIKAGPTGNTVFASHEYNYSRGCRLCYLSDGDDEVKLSLSGNIMTLLNGDLPSDTISKPIPFADIAWTGSCFIPLSINSQTQVTFTSDEVIDISKLRLPATNLYERCYFGLFTYMLGLTTVPRGVLTRATTLASECYLSMFNSCKNLNTIYCDWDPVVFSSNYTNYWLYDVSSTGTFYCNAAMKAYLESSSTTRNENTVPAGWEIKLLPD